MKTINAILLAGGKGTRLASVVSDRPKPMVDVAGKPFLEWVLTYFRHYDVQRFTISLGHMAEVAERYFAARTADGLTIKTVVEHTPLGTGGGFLYAVSAGEPADVFLLSNGDSLLLADLAPALSLLERSDVDGVLLGRVMEDASRYGTLDFDETGLLHGFAEKQPGAGVINGGVYLFKRTLVEKLPKGVPMSMETEGIPALLVQGARLQVAVSDAPFIDIGLPETYHQAEEFVRRYL
ncbi:MAG: sugar phosphate nucleotidyltransferase [Oscillospiraceae bacterium]